ncbi:MAG: GNAT family N-acetyltransferase [Alphaproteobacteria bacterium]|nr:GNAT family N-acetyltransferase [Alphaproteobacteria bacterium]
MPERAIPFSPPLPSMTAGSLEVRLAATPEDLALAQELRYRVFCEEMGASGDDLARRDSDAFDTICDHMLVVDHARDNTGNPVVGNYRLLRRSRLPQGKRFYSESEYDISCLLAMEGDILELGRSCVDSDYRTGVAMQLLWRGIGAYVQHYQVPLMFGCASLPGVDPSGHVQALSYLHHFHKAPPELCPAALPSRLLNFTPLPKEQVDSRRAPALLPPLIKGYLRAGGMIGEGAVLDHEYNTTDVCVVVRIDAVTARYRNRYAPTAET